MWPGSLQMYPQAHTAVSSEQLEAQLIMAGIWGSAISATEAASALGAGGMQLLQGGGMPSHSAMHNPTTHARSHSPASSRENSLADLASDYGQQESAQQAAAPTSLYVKGLPTDATELTL